MPRCAICHVGNFVRSAPSKLMLPDRARRYPMMLRNVVVLPAPLRPTRQTSSPAADRQADAVEDTAALDVDFEVRQIEHHGVLHGICGRVPTTAAIMAGSAKKASGGMSASTRAFLQRDDAMRVALDQIHVVLDLDDAAHAGGLRGRDQHFHDRVLVAGRNAAGRLVKQDHGWIERKGAGDIQQLLFALRKRRGNRVEPARRPSTSAMRSASACSTIVASQRAKRIADAAQTGRAPQPPAFRAPSAPERC